MDNVYALRLIKNPSISSMDFSLDVDVDGIGFSSLLSLMGHDLSKFTSTLVSLVTFMVWHESRNVVYRSGNPFLNSGLEHSYLCDQFSQQWKS